MDNELTITESSFARDLTKGFIASAVATAGMMTGFVVFGLLADRFSSKNGKNETVNEVQ